MHGISSSIRGVAARLARRLTIAALITCLMACGAASSDVGPRIDNNGRHVIVYKKGGETVAAAEILIFTSKSDKNKYYVRFWDKTAKTGPHADMRLTMYQTKGDQTQDLSMATRTDDKRVALISGQLQPGWCLGISASIAAAGKLLSTTKGRLVCRKQA